MNITPIRVRFAPSPTGMMHLGNVRTALMNYLFARKKNGIFVIRIEDTDASRNFDPNAVKIIADLAWLGLDYQEGPAKGGPFEPYYQSQRSAIYEKYVEELKSSNKIYRCFCTPEELEVRRQRQITLKQPPRYERTCYGKSAQEIERLLAADTPFIWRVYLDQEGSVTIHDLSHGDITFEYKNFSDFPITRADGSATFIFANFVDDMVMKISHVIRGEDHLTNTASQAALYQLFGVTIPTFWHLPILANKEGKKLSKRDFGFSLNDLIDAGYLPEAIDNYLATIGGGTFAQEIMNLDELTQAVNFDNVHSTGQIKYDVERLRWLNHKWIARLTPEDLANRCLPFLFKDYPQAASLEHATLVALLQTVKTDLHLLSDCATALAFMFEAPQVTTEILVTPDHTKIASFVQTHLPLITTPEEFVASLKQEAKSHNIPLNQLFWFLRMALIGKEKGPGIVELITMLGTLEARNRIEKLLG